MIDYEQVASKRTDALIAGLKQTYEEVKEKAIRDHPEEPAWFMELLCRIAWNRVRVK